ncbi:hypothetical protein LX36DRAFT_233823 [Colletotrichum falcatum]|nr:hypothetical protein LX36DRAFT_233823 [Colletotrichum falcatum]
MSKRAGSLALSCRALGGLVKSSSCVKGRPPPPWLLQTHACPAHNGGHEPMFGRLSLTDARLLPASAVSARQNTGIGSCYALSFRHAGVCPGPQLVWWQTIVWGGWPFRGAGRDRHPPGQSLWRCWVGWAHEQMECWMVRWPSTIGRCRDSMLSPLSGRTGSVCPREPVRPHGTRAPAAGSIPFRLFGKFRLSPAYQSPLGRSICPACLGSGSMSQACPGWVPRTCRRFGSRPSQVSDILTVEAKGRPARAINCLRAAGPPLPGCMATRPSLLKGHRGRGCAGFVDQAVTPPPPPWKNPNLMREVGFAGRRTWRNMPPSRLLFVFSRGV